MQASPVCSRCGTVPDPGETFCGKCGQPLQPAVTTAQVCPRCRTAVVPGETFCGNCGQSLSTVTIPQSPMQNATPSMVAPKRSSLGKVFLFGCLGLVVVLVLAAGGLGLYVWSRASYTAPNRKPPQMPQRVAGTMTEFPVDNDPNAPSAPTSVTTQSLTPSVPGSSSQAGLFSQTPLPPGLDRATLSRQASTMTTATYRPRSQTPSVTNTPASPPNGSQPGAVSGGQVIVIVLSLLPNQGGSGATIAGAVKQGTAGETTGVRVQSPNGSIYTGSRIRTPQTSVYVLEKQDASVVIIIYAADPAMQGLAERLASSVGNGEGLNDYPEVKNSLWTLPATAPTDITLEEVNTFTRAEMESSMGTVGSAAGGGGNEDVRRILEQMRQFIPERLTSARYSDASQQDWNALEFEYGSTFQAWRTWLLARGALGLSGSQSTTVLGVDALYVDQDGKRILIFQKGPYIIVLGGPSAAPVGRLIALGNQFQL